MRHETVSRQDDASTTTVDDDDASCLLVEQHVVVNTQDRRRRGRTVRIVESENTYHHDSPTTTTRPDDASDDIVDYDDLNKNNLWYTPQDFLTFRREAQELALKLQATNDPQSWSNSLMRVYFVLRVASSEDQVKRVVESCTHNIKLDETTLGLQDLYLMPICSDFILRRRHLMQQISQLQHALQQHPVRREVLIQETSLLSSHAARMYASFVAQQAALVR